MRSPVSLLSSRKKPQPQHQVDLAPFLLGLQRLDPSSAKRLTDQLNNIPVTESAKTDRAWQRQLQRSRKEILKPVQKLLNRSIELELYDLAFEFFQECLTIYPDNKVLRDALGYRQVNGEWLTSFAQQKYRKKMIWNQRLGWVPHNSEQNLAKGGWYDTRTRQWTTLQQADAKHAQLSQPWKLQTDHLLITSTLPRDKVVNVAHHLEQCYQQIFAAYSAFFGDKRLGYKLIMGMLDHKPLEVHVYRDKKQYDQALKKYAPNAPSWTAGVWIPGQNKSIFYGGVNSTMYHEFTHQVFHVFAGGNRAPIWAVEGVANYTETPWFDQLGDMHLGIMSKSNDLKTHLRLVQKKTPFPCNNCYV